ncbi:MAG: protein kinase [Verrucomicrobia bacterium]|nr:protein kinase [Verrucomicrobiota bacterium]
MTPGPTVESKSSDSSVSPPTSAKNTGFNQPDDSRTRAPHAQPPSIPDYELLRRIGGGSYGEVWLARSATGASRALKIVWRHTFEDDRPFQREFEGIQRFERLSREHPSQLALFHVGRGEGYFYYVMELADDARTQRIDGVVETWSNGKTLPTQHSSTPALQDPSSYAPKTLRSLLRPNTQTSTPIDREPALDSQPTTDRLPAARVLEIGLALTEALAHLHGNGLVHRDVKPSNIIFVGGKPKLADIGLVTDASDTCSIVGTEGYLAPEGPGTPQADVFALGKVLYEALTGFERRQFPQLPPDLRDWPDAKLAFELNEIILKACDSEARRRYQSAEEMRAELALLQRGKSVKGKRALQHWLAVSKKAGLTVSLLAVAVAAVVVLRQSPRDPYHHSANPEVNDLVGEGNHVVQGRSAERVRTALGYFNRAVELDPSFVPARYGVFRALVSRGAAEQGASAVDRAHLRAIAKQLMEMDSNLAESRAASSMIKWIDWQFPEALAEARLATQKRAASKEGETSAHNYYGYFLVQSGRPGEALEQYKIAKRLSPSNPIIDHHLGHPYFATRRFEEALKHYRESLEMEGRQETAHYWIGRVYLEQTSFMAAIDEFEEGEKAVGRTSSKREFFFETLREASRQDPVNGYWSKRLELALQESKPDLYEIATLYARLGDKPKAYRYLREACEKKAFDQGLMFDLCWDHEDKEFKAIARGIRLLQ